MLGVVALFRNDVPDTAARVGHVARIPRNQVDMEVEDRLPGRWAAIDADIVAIGPVVLLDDHFDRVQRFEERGAFFGTGFEPGGYVADWNKKSVTRRHRVAVPQPIRKFVAEEDAVGWRVAEETGCSIGTGNGVVLALIYLARLSMRERAFAMARPCDGMGSWVWWRTVMVTAAW